jgi:hypothetical protein
LIQVFGMAILRASELTLKEVHRLLRYQADEGVAFEELLHLESLSTVEKAELLKIRQDFNRYRLDGQVLEGQVRLLAKLFQSGFTTAPLLRLSGFFDMPIQMQVEEGIERITVQNGEHQIAGRMDLVAFNLARMNVNQLAFCVLIIESKESQIDALAGLPQLLTYAQTFLEQQPLVWGLTTNGVSYRFVEIRGGVSPQYRLMPELNLIDLDRTVQILQVLKAICRG